MWKKQTQKKTIVLLHSLQYSFFPKQGCIRSTRRGITLDAENIYDNICLLLPFLNQRKTLLLM